MADIYTVVKGDTLRSIAKKFNTTVAKLVSLNNIQNPDHIVVGQKLRLKDDAPAQTTTALKTRAVVNVFGLQSNTDRTVYASWVWNEKNTENYEVMWYYATGDGIWFVGSESTEKYKQSLYNAPSNATKVKFKVKPISKKRKVNNTDTAYWTASWSTEKTYNFSDNPPSKPSAPDVKVDKYTLTATLNNLDINAKSVQFQVVKNDTSVYKTGTATIKTGTATFSCTIKAGDKYKVRCRGVRNGIYGEWSDYSSNENSIPSVPKKIEVCKATSETSVLLGWISIQSATSYDIEYTTEKKYFDITNQTSKVTDIQYDRYELTGLESGKEYFFRIRAVNEKGSSGWSPIKSIIIGKKPAAPTTWSSTITAVLGENITFYWVHNTEDGSSQTFAELELTVNGVSSVITIKNTENEEEKDKTSTYTIDPIIYGTSGSTIEWRVRTAGITKAYGEWSVKRVIKVYAPVTLELSANDYNGNLIETLYSFPLYISAIAGPTTQTPIGYHVTVIANDSYETVDNVGKRKIVSAGDAIYSKHYNTNTDLLIELSAGNIDLENNVNYTIKCIVSMNSGLTGESSIDFTVSWMDELYEPNAEIGIDTETYSAYIRPYCEDENEVRISDLLLSVYRREYDGSFVELATNIDNSTNTFITDPHPALDYARYRVVAISKTTGAVSYYDVPGYPVGCKSVIIQWDEDWSNFDVVNEDEMEEPTWSGSLLKLSYNIDVSDNYNPDVSLVKYIGREHPVSYYGTQLGVESTWSVSIDKDDKETLYAIRRLAIWTGDVYVREPSGSGYWANVKVSFSQKHCELTIPITLSVTRVSGGV